MAIPVILSRAYSIWNCAVCLPPPSLYRDYAVRVTKKKKPFIIIFLSFFSLLCCCSYLYTLFIDICYRLFYLPFILKYLSIDLGDV